MGRHVINYLILLTFFAFAGAAAYADNAKLEMVNGAPEISVMRDGKPLKLKAGEKLLAGDEVTTDDHTSADIRFDDETLVRVGVNSTYKIVQEGGTSKFIHKLFSGIVRVLVPVKKEGKSEEIKFKMNTPEGTIGVRGTEFTVERQGNKTTLKGLSGEVMFGGADADFAHPEAFVGVGRGFESAVNKGDAKPAAVKKYDMDSYLKSIDKKGGLFGQLDKPTALNMVRRSEPVKSAVTKSAASMAPLKKEPEKAAPVAAAAPAAKAKGKTDPNTLLLLAIEANSDAKLKDAIAKGADVKRADENGVTALHHMVIRKNAEVMIQRLIEAGANVDAKNNMGVTPLMQIAVDNGPVANAEVLLSNKANPNLKTKDGVTALDIAKSKPADKPLIEFLESVTD